MDHINNSKDATMSQLFVGHIYNSKAAKMSMTIVIPSAAWRKAFPSHLPKRNHQDYLPAPKVGGGRKQFLMYGKVELCEEL